MSHVPENWKKPPKGLQRPVTTSIVVICQSTISLPTKNRSAASTALTPRTHLSHQSPQLLTLIQPPSPPKRLLPLGQEDELRYLTNQRLVCHRKKFSAQHRSSGEIAEVRSELASFCKSRFFSLPPRCQRPVVKAMSSILMRLESATVRFLTSRASTLNRQVDENEEPWSGAFSGHHCATAVLPRLLRCLPACFEVRRVI